MRRRRQTAYEYEDKEPRVYKQKIRRSPRLKVLDVLLFLLVIPAPAIGVGLRLIGLPIPSLLLAAYSAVTLTAAGLLFIILTACNVGGFGKVGFCFSHTHGKRWMTTAEAKGNTYLFGFFMLLIGVMA
ncbi:MAG: hypothetical protein IKU51_05810, partial [Clostridia bacterium]|nr:hypothetical protein [Clostridia bacterium]